MLIAVLSDIHDNLWKLDAALPFLRDCDVMICCGDLCSPFIIDELAQGFPKDVHIVFGNNDADLFRITGKLKKFPNVHLHGELCEIELGGKRFAVNHFDYLARPIAKSGLYDVVCFGHNHEFEITRYEQTLAINPGAILGAKFPGGKRQDTPSTFVTYETGKDVAKGYRIEADCRTVTPLA
jgi:uncharacterized protein